MTPHPLANQRVLVTGAAGFIGSHLCEALVRAGARTRAFVRYTSGATAGWLDTLDAPTRTEIEVVRGDLRDADTVDRAGKGCDVVLHLGALIAIPYSYEAPFSYLRTNVEGTLNVLEAARRHGSRRVVQTSTSEVFGTARRVPIDEEHPRQAQSPYAASKIASDALAQSFHLSFGLPVVIVRPFNTYGPRQSARAVIPTIIAQALAGASEIRLGNLDPRRDLNHVSDTVEAFLAAASAGEEANGRDFNFGSGREIRIGDLAGLLLRLCGSDARIVSDAARLRPAGSEVERLVADSTRARTLLGWAPRVSLEDGLRDTIDWMRGNAHAYRPNEYTR